MIIKNGEENQISEVLLPAAWAIDSRREPLHIRQLAAPPEIVPCRASALQSRNGKINRLLLQRPSGGSIVVATREPDTLFESDAASVLLLKAPGEIVGGRLSIPNQHRWHRHPRIVAEAAAIAARESWETALTFVEEDPGRGRTGLRLPQAGALHAISAHWSVSRAPALVVMPTGTGKTEVMLAALVMRRPKRLLVIVPTDALRTQTVGKFITLGILPKLGVLRTGVAMPVVGAVHGMLDATDTKRLEICNVVVATMSALAGMGIIQLRKLAALFDTVFFDEAHHLPANSWDRLNDLLQDHSVLQFTATPFRLDGRRIPGRIIYNFPLRLAQQQGYFREIDFVDIAELDDAQADHRIAEAAVARLRADRTAGFAHILLARADTKARAEAIYRNIYSARHADLDPVLIHSGVPKRREKLQAIRDQKHLIVVCVDMFGEGYDLPQLKVAALHDMHKSLAVTLQFVGRFTRTASGLGGATVVANVAAPDVSEAIEELYAEDSDWNELIPKLSARAVQSQVDFSDFLHRMEKSDISGEELFSLNVIRPKTSTVMYRVASFSPRLFKKAVRKGVHIEGPWIGKDKDYLVYITRTREAIDWASIKAANDEIWDVFIVAYDEKRRLLYIHSSQTGTLHEELARAVSGDSAKIVSGEAVFRALHNLKRITLQNVGLKPRGNKLRFHMFVGPDVVDMIAPAAQINAAKSNLFALGYDEGRRTTVGVSVKGRMWSRSSGSIPDWRAWCERIATRVLDSTIPTDAFLKHTLVPEEIVMLPDLPLFGVELPTDWFTAEMDSASLFAGAREFDLHTVGITSWATTGRATLEFNLSAENLFDARFELTWGPQKGEFSVRQVAGPDVEIRHRGNRARFDEYLRFDPPTVFLANGAEINGGLMHSPPTNIQYTIELSRVEAWDWADVDRTKESLWKNGVRRSKTVQGYVLQTLATRKNAIVFDDDDAGETADVVEIVDHEEEIIVRFYHCKFSQSDFAGDRAKDLYEVCGQAVRSTRWHYDPENFLNHLQRRAAASGLNGRLTRFEKGSEKELIQLKRKVRQVRVRYEVAIAQPGISRSKLTSETATILGAASNFLLEMTGAPLAIITDV